MSPFVPLLALLALARPPSAADAPAMEILLPAEPLVSSNDARTEHLVPAGRELGKKALWLREKARRPNVRASDSTTATNRRANPAARRTGSSSRDAEARLGEAMPAVGNRIQPITTLYNLWNREALALLAGRPYKRPFQLFLRDHYTKESTHADTRLATVLAAAAIHFRAPRVDIVSGYRSPKYNLMLRKKGRQVARESQHVQGTAVDFRLRGVTTEALREFVRGLRVGGVGYYPRTQFVHADTGKVRYWSGS